MSPDPPLLRCVDLRVGHGGRAILPAIDVEVGRGQLWAVVGRNGSGKTTLFRTLLGLIPPVAGAVLVDASLPLSYVPQRSSLDPLFPASAADVVRQGLQRPGSWLSRQSDARVRVREALEQAGAAPLARRPFRALSEGQKQRVLLARTLAGRPALALMDEPTSAMDEVAEAETLACLDALRRQHGTTVFVVSHQLGPLASLADRALLLDVQGAAVIAGDPASVMADPAFVRTYGTRSPEPRGGA